MYATKKNKGSTKSSKKSLAVQMGYKTKASRAGCVLGAKSLGRRSKYACGTTGITTSDAAYTLGIKEKGSGYRAKAKAAKQLSLFGKGKRAKSKR